MASMALKRRVGLSEEEKKKIADAFRKTFESRDINKAKHLISKYPGELPENPLHFACKQASNCMAMKIGETWPEFASYANQNGDIAMHLVSAVGNIEMVEFLEKLNPGSCLVKNNNSMIPLHIAAEKGQCPVIRKLVSLCPESLKMLTSMQETVFHLAVNNSQSAAFQVLLDEAKKLNFGHILNNKNNDGNTVLHIAVLKRLTDIVNLLLPEPSSSSSHIKIQFNTMNNEGLTALDMCPVDSPEIRLILQNFAGNEMPSLESQQKSRVVALTGLPMATTNVLLVVLILIAGAAFSVTYSLPDALIKEMHRSSLQLHYATASDVISGRLPSIIYLMTFNSTEFMICMLLISLLLWSLPLRSIILFAMVCISIVYFILVDKILPKLDIRVGNFTFSSTALVLSSALVITFCALTFNKICRLRSSGD